MIDYKNKTRQELEDKANAITWESHYHQVMVRLHPHSQFEFGDLSQTGEALYDEISPYQLVGESKIYDTKLPWSDVQTEVGDYKSEQLAIIDRVFRGLALWNWGQAIYDSSLYSDSIDHDDFIKKVGNGSESNLLTLESSDAAAKSKSDYKQAVQERLKKMSVGSLCIATVNYLNDINLATDAQVTAQLSSPDVQLIMQSLQAGSLERAKTMVINLDLTGLEPMSQDYKDKVLALIDEYLGG